MKNTFEPLKKSFSSISWATKIATVSILLATIIINSCTPLIFKKSLEVILSTNSLEIYYILILYSFLWLMGQMVNNLRSYLVSQLVEDISCNITLALFNHLHSLSLRFHSERKVGTIAHVLGNIPRAIEVMLWGGLLFVIPTILEITIALIVMSALYGIYYTCILALIFMIFIVVGIVGNRAIENTQIAYSSQRAATKTFLLESLAHAETVKYFAGQAFETEQAISLIDAQKSSARSFAQSTMFIQNVQASNIGAGLMLLFIMIAYQVRNNTLNISDFILVQSYILQFMVPLSSLGYLYFQLKKSWAEVIEALTFFDHSPEIIDSDHAQTLNSGPVSIEFSSVHFSYSKDHSMLKNCSFTLEPGKTIALVGPTGSGKTSIIRLLLRFYDVTDGRVTINGIDIKNVTLSSLHKRIGYIPQEPLLFNNTLKYNIIYGAPDATTEDISYALHLAHLDYFIAMQPEKLETLVGDKGLKISGGEKQRIALARAFLRKPSLFILDEATSALDSKTEQIIMKNIQSMYKDVSRVIIAHRLSSIIDADEIIVLNQGTIVQKGTHDQLITQNGLYAQLWAAQNQTNVALHQTQPVETTL